MTTLRISGSTRFVAMLGDPIAQVKTPTAFAEWALDAGEDAVMVPVQVPAEGLEKTFEGLRSWENCAGAVVTYPHKQATADLVDRRDQSVEIVGACNVVRRSGDGRLHGTMTDGLGFLAAVEHGGHTVRAIDAILVGAGGAGSAIALALVDAGIKRLVVIDADHSRRSDLVRRLGQLRPAADIHEDVPADLRCSLICNATPVGMNGDTRHPYPLNELTRDCLVADIVPKPEMTPWLTKAQERGHPIQTGSAMVRAQLPAVVAHLFPALER